MVNTTVTASLASQNSVTRKGVAANRRMAPKARSKPRPIARRTNAIDRTASARTLGARNWTGSSTPVGSTSTVLKKINSAAGIPTVSRSCS